MFTNAHDALEWLRARGYPALPRPQPVPPPIGGMGAEAVLECYLLVRAQRPGDSELRIYWTRVKRELNVGCFLQAFARKHRNIYFFCLIHREGRTRLGTGFPDRTAVMGARSRRAELLPWQTDFIDAVRYDPNVPHKEQWLRVLLAMPRRKSRANGRARTMHLLKNPYTMFTNAHDALEWLRARGYPTLGQPLPLEFPFGGERVQAVQEFALLVKAEREGDLPLHIYWMRVATGFDNVSTLVGEFAKKYPQILPLFFVRRERSLMVWIAYPDPTAQMGYRKKSRPLDPNAKELLAALCYDPATPHEKHWRRILRAITGEDAMHTRIDGL